MKRYVRWSRLCSLLVAFHFVDIDSFAKDKWIRVDSANFSLVGNDSEKNLRQVALKFEQFREAFSRIFPKMKLKSSVPTRVLVFKSDSSFKPFKPLYQGKPAALAGFYQKGADVNHICLTSEYSEERPFAAIFHEYVHQLTGDNLRLPVWFSEGIAEYYSTFEASDKDWQVSLGKPIASHIYGLREARFLPLKTLFAIGHDSPEYGERQKKGVFYAESWALVHYLMTADKEKHRPKLIQYLSLLAAGESLEQSFAKAFQTDYDTMEEGLRNYIQQNTYGYTIHKFEKKLEIEEPLRAEPLSEAEVPYYLGDLLLHTNRLEDAEKHLKLSLQSNPGLAPALASMGVLRLRQKQWSEARDYFQKAAKADSGNYLVHYHYANLLLHDESEGGASRLVSSSEKFRTVQLEVKRAIELAPWFVESYRLLAYAANMTGEELPVTVELLKKARAYAPGREDLRLDLARLYARMEDYSAASQLAESIARQSSELQVQQEAQVFLSQLQAFEEQRRLVARARQQPTTLREPTAEDIEPTAEDSEPPAMKRRTPSPRPSTESSSTSALQLNRPRGERIDGVLTRLECNENGVMFVVQSGTKTFKFHTDDPEKLLLYKENGEILGTINMTCGPLSPASQVVVTYRKPSRLTASCEGILMSVLFVHR